MISPKLKITTFILYPLWLLFSAPSLASIMEQKVEQKVWQFKVFLDDKEIGYHKVTLKQNKHHKEVTTEAQFEVKLLFFTAYRYQHHNREIWAKGCLKSIHSNTNDNGDTFFVNHQETSQSYFRVNTQDGLKQFPTCIRSFAYWDRELLDAPRLLNSQTGNYQHTQLQAVGSNLITIGDKNIEASQYHLSVDDEYIDLWYSNQAHWLALQSTTENGSVIRYLLQPEQQL